MARKIWFVASLIDPHLTPLPQLFTFQAPLAFLHHLPYHAPLKTPSTSSATFSSASLCDKNPLKSSQNFSDSTTSLLSVVSSASFLASSFAGTPPITITANSTVVF